MSGYVLIYDQAGVDPHCGAATYRQIKELSDDRSLRVEYFSARPTALDDTSNPVCLFVIPGGNYREMEKDLAPLASKINRLVTEEGASYLGICAGAIAATSTPLVMHFGNLIPDTPPTKKQEFEEVPELPPHINLYSGNCSALMVRGSGLCGTQSVREISSDDAKPYPLFFQSGVFFPNASRQPDATSLLEYASYRFSGTYTPPEGPRESYENVCPIAAVTQEVGEGRILLSGVHPEIDPDTVKEFPTVHPAQEAAKEKARLSLMDSRAEQMATMRDYLEVLSIATKKALS